MVPYILYGKERSRSSIFLGRGGPSYKGLYAIKESTGGKRGKERNLFSNKQGGARVNMKGRWAKRGGERPMAFFPKRGGGKNSSFLRSERETGGGKGESRRTILPPARGKRQRKGKPIMPIPKKGTVGENRCRIEGSRTHLEKPVSHAYKERKEILARDRHGKKIMVGPRKSRAKRKKRRHKSSDFCLRRRGIPARLMRGILHVDALLGEQTGKSSHLLREKKGKKGSDRHQHRGKGKPRRKPTTRERKDGGQERRTTK